MLTYRLETGFFDDLGAFHLTRNLSLLTLSTEGLPDAISQLTEEYPLAFSGDEEEGTFTFSDSFIVHYHLVTVAVDEVIRA